MTAGTLTFCFRLSDMFSGCDWMANFDDISLNNVNFTPAETLTNGWYRLSIDSSVGRLQPETVS